MSQMFVVHVTRPVIYEKSYSIEADDAQEAEVIARDWASCDTAFWEGWTVRVEDEERCDETELTMEVWPSDETVEDYERRQLELVFKEIHQTLQFEGRNEQSVHDC